MDALIFLPWFATPRSLLAADGVVVYLKKKKKWGLVWRLNCPSYRDLLSTVDSPLVLSAAAAMRSCMHDVFRWAT
jgi:hypothetical protein